MKTTFPALLAVLTTASLPAQDLLEVQGTVVDPDEQPVAGARIDFHPLPKRSRPRSGQRGRYDLAQTRHREATGLPRTATDRNGRWRVMLSPHQAALAASGSQMLEMQVHADGHPVWHRAIGGSLVDADGITARLERTTPGLELLVQAPQGEPLRGVVRVERSFRAGGNRAVWRATSIPIPADGRVRFDQPSRIPGEAPPSAPVVRSVEYRVSVFAAGMDSHQQSLHAGSHAIELERSVFPPREVRLPDDSPAPGPIEATWRFGDTEHTLEFDAPAVPMLGDVEPATVRSPAGPVEIDVWDPDDPMYVIADDAPSRDEDHDAAHRFALRLTVQDAHGEPVFGAAAWIENRVVERAADDAVVFGLSDAQGAITLTGLPSATPRVLVQHPTAGRAEILATTTRSETRTTVDLAPVVEEVEEPVQRAFAGALTLDLGAIAAGTPIQVGVLTGTRAARGTQFDSAPPRVLIEGIEGPTDFFVQIEGASPWFFGAFLAGSLDAPAIPIVRPASRTITLDVKNSQGEPAVVEHVSLGDAGVGERPPLSSRFFQVRAGTAAGRYEFDLAITGRTWVRVHGAGGETQEVEVGESGPTEHRVDLRAVPTPEEPPKEGGGDDGGL